MEPNYQIEEWDLRTIVQDNELSRTIQDIANKAEASLDIENGPVAKLVVYHTFKGDYVMAVIHHLFVDGVSWRVLTEDMNTAYRQLKDGKEVELPLKTHSYKEYSESLETYRKSYELQQEKSYWEGVLSDMRKYPLSVGNDYSRKMNTVVRQVNKDTTDAIVHNASKAYNTTINDLLLTAVGRSYAKVFDAEGLSLQFEGHGREPFGQTPLAIDRTVGWFTSMYPVVIDGLTSDIRKDIRRVKEILHRIPNNGFGFGQLFGISPEETPLMIFNYMGDLSESGSNDGTGAQFTMSGDFSTGLQIAPENCYGSDFSLNILVENGQFQLLFTYNTALCDESRAKGFVAEMESQLGAIAQHTSQISVPELTASDLGETQWSDDAFEKISGEYASRNEMIQRIYPITPMQEAMLLKHISEPDSWGYRLVNSFELDIVPTESQLRAVLDKLGRKHEVLRTAIIYEGVYPYRQAIIQRPLGLRMVDLSNSADPYEEARKLREDILSHGFDLQRKPLFHLTCAKISDTRSILITAVHHIIVDGWCLGIYMGDLMNFLDAEIKGAGLSDTQLSPVNDGVYEKAVREIISKDMDAARDYWCKLLEGYENKAEIHSFGVVPESERSDADQQHIKFDKATTDSLFSLSLSEGATQSNVVELLWGLLLQIYSRTDDVVFAKVVSGRDNTQIDVNTVVGLFLNSIPVRVSRTKETTARQALRSLQRQASESNEFDFCSLSEIQKLNDLGSELFQSVIAFENYNSGYDTKNDKVPDLSFHIRPITVREENFDDIAPAFYVDPEDGCLSVNISFNRSKYRKIEMERLSKCLQTLAMGIAANPDMPLCRIPALDGGELRHMLDISTGAPLPYNAGETFVDMVLAQAASQPSATAVVDATGSISYGELSESSLRLGAWLRRQGVSEGDFVCIMLPRIKEFVVSVLAVQRIGAAYVPVDIDYPEDRRRFMIEDSGAKVVIDEETLRTALSSDTAEEPSLNLSRPDGRAYMIYTSGTTGKPKGVVVSHRSIRACAAWMLPEFGLGPGKQNLNHPSFSFDASTFDLFYPLMAGATIHIASESLRMDMDAMNRYIIENGITGMTMSTALGMSMLNQYDLGLEYIMLGGEKFLPVKKTSVRLYNGYGPTEFTVCSSYHIIDQDRAGDIPIGRAVPNSSSYICDPYGNLLPQGVAGELCLSGDQLSEGYWNRDDQTSEKFVAMRFAPGRMYRTGDLARYNEAGELEFLGRIDTQVKLRGFRIELGEIEHQASTFAGVAQAVAEVKSIAGGSHLVLYYTQLPGEEVPEESLKAHLSSTLTDYMVPEIFMRLGEMPMTPGGKIDRKSLPLPEIQSSTRYEEPSGETERKLAEAFARILGVSSAVGALDNFFELGGDSIKAIRLVSTLRQEGITLQVSDILKQKTVRNIARVADEDHREESVSQEPWSGVLEDSAIVCFFRELNLPQPHHFLMSVLYECRERADAAKLQKALDALTTQHDVLRAVMRDGHLMVRPAECTIALEEMNCPTKAEAEATLRRIKSSISMEQSLARFVLIHTVEKDYLLLAVHHLIDDAVSVRIISSDLELAYAQLSSGSGQCVLPAKTNTYNDYVESQRKYRDSYQLSLEIPYWERVQRELEQLPTSLAKDYGRRMAYIGATLGAEETGRFLASRADLFGADINDLLLTCVSRAYCKMAGTDKVSVQLEGHGREDMGTPLATDRTVGWFTSVYPVVFSGITQETASDLRVVKETLHRVPNKGVGYNVLRFLPNREETPAFEIDTEHIALIGFNYLGEMGGEASAEGSPFFRPATDVDPGEDFASENVFGPDLSINCLVAGGQFRLSLGYNSLRYSEEQARTLSEGILTEMKALPSFLSSQTERQVTASDLGEMEWSDAEFRSVVDEFASRGEHLERIYPLTPMQEGMLLKHLSEPQSWAYRLVSIFELGLDINEQQLCSALDRLGRKHEVLRTSIISEGVGQYRQAIVSRSLGHAMADLSKESDPQESVLKLREEILAGYFDLQRKPLFHVTCARKDEKCCYLIVSVHHIIVDGWCLSLYLNDLFSYLDAEVNGKEIIEPNIGSTDGKYEQAVREILSKDMTAARRYWSKLLEGYDTKAEVHSWRSIPASEQNYADECVVAIPKPLTESLTKLCQDEKATLSNAAEMAWGLLLHTYSRTDDAVFAKVVSGRDNTSVDVSNVVGLFLNSVPVRVRKDKDTTARMLLRELQRQSASSNDYDFCPLGEIQNESSLGSDLFQSVLAFENYNSGKEESSDIGESFRIRVISSKEENFDEITPILTIDENGELVLKISFDKSLYTFEEIQRVAWTFRTIVENIVSHPDTPLSDLSFVSDESQCELLSLGKGEELAYDHSETLVDLIRRQAKATPDATAVVFEEKRLSYRELDDITDRLASLLISRYAVRKEEAVGVMIERSELMAIYPLAIMKAGGAYMPLDFKFPAERLQYMCEDAGVRLILSEGNRVQEAMPDYNGETYLWSGCEAFPTATSPLPELSPADRYVLLYTSGSTGKPKGVVLEHHNIVNFCHWYVKEFDVTPADRAVAYANFGFDAHMMDLYPALSAGASVYIIPSGMRMDLEAMNDYMESNRLSIAFITTQIGYLFATGIENSSLRLMSVGGEKLMPLRKPRYRFYNGYGPTECTLYSTFYNIDRDYDSSLIGRPLSNYQLYVVDSCLNLVPRGVAGELVVSGEGVARGYLHPSEKDAGKFTTIGGVKCYRTGDLVRWSEDGNIEYLGRLDNQVKLRGLRIELGEIESKVLGYAGIRQCCVDVKEINGVQNLCCYYTVENGAEVDEESLKKSLKENLTDYMVPEIYVKLENLPLTSNGKVDRKALPVPQVQSAVEYVAPSTEAEKKLCAAIGRLLNTGSPISVLDSFNALGGDSIKAIRLVSALRQDGITLQVSQIMKLKVIRDIAAAAQMAGGEVEISQEAVTGPVPNSAIIEHFFALDMPVPAHFNQAFIIHAQKRVDVKCFRNTLNALCVHHDMLRAVVKEGSLNIRPADAENLYGWSEEQAQISASDLHDACTRIQASMNLEEGPLFKVCLFHLAESDVILFALHHLIVDGVSWRILLEDLNSAYQKVVNGEAIRLPLKSNSYKEYAEALAVYAGSYELSLEIPYWQKTIKKINAQPAMACADGPAAFESVMFELEAPQTEKLLGRCSKAYNTEVNDLLLTALLRGYHKMTGEKGMALMMEGHGREPFGNTSLEIDRTVGWFTSIYPVYVESTCESLRDDIRNVKETMHRIPDKGFGYNVLQHLRHSLPSCTGHTITFNYLGQISESGMEKASFFIDGKMDSGEASVPENSKETLSINSIVSDGKLTVPFVFDPRVWNRTVMQRFADDVKNELNGIVAHCLQVSKPEQTASDLGETLWSDAEFQAVEADFEAHGESLQRIYPLTPMQQGMLMHHLIHPDDWAYRLVNVYSMDLCPTESQLSRALEKLAGKYEAMRTSIIYQGVSTYRQAIVKGRRMGCTMLDWSERTDLNNSIREFRKELISTIFDDLQHNPLLNVSCARRSDGGCFLFISIHHLITDGWSTQLYFGDLLRMLACEMHLSSPEILPGVENTDGKFEQYVRILEKKDRIKGLDYWKGLLDGYDTKSAIPSYGKVTAEEEAMSLYDIREDVISRLRKICSEEDVTFSNALELAWGLTLQTYSRQEDAVFLKVVSGRDNVSEDMSKVMGAFINSVPVRVRQGKDMTVRQMLHSMQKQSAESNEYDYCSLSEILKLTPLGNNLFQSIITFQNFIESNGTSANADNPLGIKPAFIKEENVNEVAATFLLSDDKLSIDLKYDKTLFSARQMKGVLDLFATILENMAMNPEKAVNNLPRTASREDAISFCQGITLPYNAEETFVDMVLSQAASQPSATAVVDATGSISYGELAESSQRLGAWLRRQGVSEGDFVCIMLPRIKEFVVSVLAVQRIGAAYVPVDREYPEDRRRFMIEDSGAKVVIDEETLRTALSSDTAEEPSLNLSRPDGRAYMIYTSGTTGKPKGAILLHKGLRAFIAWNNSMLHQGPDTRHLVHASFSFDASIFDMLCPLAAGSQVHILSETLRRDLDGIAAYIRDNSITGMLVTTQVGMALLNGFDLPLEYMMLGGEKMLPVRKTGIRVINAYGPTEFTAASTTYEVQGDETDIPIGRPVPNSTGYVCDRYGNILPQGVAGELVMEGVQLGGGYWNREEQTREKFAGGRYRTGDLVRYDENGNLLYLGRIDTQVKLRGFRIELGEIESRAASHPMVVQAAAEVMTSGSVQTLVLYYTVSGQLSPEDLRTYVSETLTDYMVPDVFMQLDEMPMTPGGKIDRKALPVPERTVSVDWLDSVGKSAVTQGSSRKNPFSKR